MYICIYTDKVIMIFFLIGGDASANTIRLLGYSIRGSTNRLISDTKVCYSDNSGILPTVIEAGCKVLARYIWFYQSHSQSDEVPILEICEVQVFGTVFCYSTSVSNINIHILLINSYYNIIILFICISKCVWCLTFKKVKFFFFKICP